MAKLPRRQNTSRQHIRLSVWARAEIRAFAEQEGVSFSTAIEYRARLGLGQGPEDAMQPVAAGSLRHEIAQRSYRVASLIAEIAAEKEGGKGGSAAAEDS